MRRMLVLTLVALAACGAAGADEGMWTPDQLPRLGEALESAGLVLDATTLADLDGYPLGAVVSLGGCTGSFVSDRGLVVTNHHCAYGSLQHNSTPEHDVLETGFLARSLDEELPAAPGSRVLVTTRAEDVTDRILAAVPAGARGKARYDAVEAAEKTLVAACEEPDGVRCRVVAFWGGLRYRLFTQIEIRDVRIVYAPARSVGKYGGEIDNWMWPRHTGDFSFLRAYVGPDGRPAEPAPENVPYRPKQWLRVAPEGVADGDFVMVAGFPGRTNRYRLADEVEASVDWYYPRAREVFGAVLASVERAVEQYPDAAITVAPTLAGLNNRLKNYDGMLAGFDRTDVVSAKRALETDLGDWIAADPARAAKYGGAIDDLRALVAREQRNRERDLVWGVVRGWPLLRAASRLVRLAHEREKPDADREPGYQERDLARMRQGLERMQSTYDRRVDRAVAADRIRMYAALPADRRVPAFDRSFGIGAEGADDAALDRSLDAMYASTGLETVDGRLAWMDASVGALASSDDPFLRLAVALYPTDLEMEAEDETLDGLLDEARPRFMEALIAYQRERGLPVYPDANSTLRVTYGHVAGYRPRDGVVYEPFTTVEGLLEKETGAEPFDSPPALLEAVRARAFGPYAARPLGSVPIDFLSTVDTTGGNSGSPTLDARGRLVGLLFDGAWESLLSDWYYEPERVRSIHADVRYMLWVMDRVDGAGDLLREMGIDSGAAAAPAAAGASSGAQGR